MQVWVVHENGMKGLMDHIGGASSLDKAIEMNVLHQISVLRMLEFIQYRENEGELAFMVGSMTLQVDP